jgi:hypothetical protein
MHRMSHHPELNQRVLHMMVYTCKRSGRVPRPRSKSHQQLSELKRHPERAAPVAEMLSNSKRHQQFKLPELKFWARTSTCGRASQSTPLQFLANGVCVDSETESSITLAPTVFYCEEMKRREASHVRTPCLSPHMMRGCVSATVETSCTWGTVCSQPPKVCS